MLLTRSFPLACSAPSYTTQDHLGYIRMVKSLAVLRKGATTAGWAFLPQLEIKKMLHRHATGKPDGNKQFFH